MPALGHPRDLSHGFVMLVQVAAENEVCQLKKKTGRNRVGMRNGFRCWIPPRSKKGDVIVRVDLATLAYWEKVLQRLKF